MRMPYLAIPLLLLAVMAVTACDNKSGGGGGLQVTASEFKYEPANLTAKVGQATTVSLKNSGTQAHDWVVQGMDTPVSLNAVQPGQTGNVTFTPTKAGT